MASISNFIHTSCRACLLQHRTRPAILYDQVRTKVYTGRVAVPESKHATSQVMTKDLLLYVHKNPMYLAKLGFFYVGGALFCVNAGYSFTKIGEFLTKLGKVQTEERKPEEGFIRRYISQFSKGTFHRVFSALFYGLGAALLITLAAVPFRTVKSIVLMKNNKDVCISMYASLSGSKHKVLPISKVKSRFPVHKDKSVIVIVENRRLPFYMSRTGKVLNADLLKRVLQKETKAIAI